MYLYIIKKKSLQNIKNDDVVSQFWYTLKKFGPTNDFKLKTSIPYM